MSLLHGSGTPLDNSFSFSASRALDERLQVLNTEELQNLLNQNLAYAGLITYNSADNKYYFVTPDNLNDTTGWTSDSSNKATLKYVEYSPFAGQDILLRISDNTTDISETSDKLLTGKALYKWVSEITDNITAQLNVIKSTDSTTASDTNWYSALASDNRYLLSNSDINIGTHTVTASRFIGTADNASKTTGTLSIDGYTDFNGSANIGIILTYDKIYTSEDKSQSLQTFLSNLNTSLNNYLPLTGGTLSGALHAPNIFLSDSDTGKEVQTAFNNDTLEVHYPEGSSGTLDIFRTGSSDNYDVRINFFSGDNADREFTLPSKSGTFALEEDIPNIDTELSEFLAADNTWTGSNSFSNITIESGDYSYTFGNNNITINNGSSDISLTLPNTSGTLATEDSINTLKSAYFTGDSAKKAVADKDGNDITTTYIKVSEKGVNNGVATLDNSGKIPSSQLPSYVDDIVEGNYSDGSFTTIEGSPITPETGKIYIDVQTNLQYRWSGSQYVVISSSLALGTTSSTAFPGDRGLALETNLSSHIGNKDNPHEVTKSQVGLSNVDNTADADKPVSTAQAAAITDAKQAGLDAQSSISAHAARTDNPHSVTKLQVGLGNVDNTSDLNKPISTATQEALNNKVNTTDFNVVKGYFDQNGNALRAVSDSDGNNIIETYATKAEIGSSSSNFLNNANTWTKPQTFNQGIIFTNEANKTVSLDYNEVTDILAQTDKIPTIETNITGISSDLSELTSKVTQNTTNISALQTSDNTQNTNISKLQGYFDTSGNAKTANNSYNDKDGNDITTTYIKLSAKGVANGVATLDDTGLIPASQLPSFVDDVVEYPSVENFPETGTSGKIYVDTSTNKTYRWSGTQYTEISSSLALGETADTAYAGDKGKQNATNIAALQVSTAALETELDNHVSDEDNPHNVTKSQIGLGSVVNAAMDDTPTADSNNYVKSGGVKSYVDTQVSSKYSKPASGIPATDLTTEIQNQLSQIQYIGDLSQLNTNEKDNLVDAINEIAESPLILPENLVKTDEVQEITAQKTFSGPAIFTNTVNIGNSSITGISGNIDGSSKDITRITGNTFFDNSAIFGDASGIFTTGISGITQTTPGDDGNITTTRGNLYLNYDGTVNYTHKVILGANTLGTARSIGDNTINDYVAVRGLDLYNTYSLLNTAIEDIETSAESAYNLANTANTNANAAKSTADANTGNITTLQGYFTDGKANEALSAVNDSDGNPINTTYIKTTAKGIAGGVATLDSTGVIPANQLPSFVDDIIEGTLVNSTTFNDTAGSPITPATGKIYVDTSDNTQYRWSGSQYTVISKSITLGTGENQAYPGNLGNTNATNISTLQNNIGTVSNLKTSSKVLVPAINEIFDTSLSRYNSLNSSISTINSSISDISTIRSNASTALSTANANKTSIGTLASLDTEVKTDLVSSINEVLADIPDLTPYSTTTEIQNWVISQGYLTAGEMGEIDLTNYAKITTTNTFTASQNFSILGSTTTIDSTGISMTISGNTTLYDSTGITVGSNKLTYPTNRTGILAIVDDIPTFTVSGNSLVIHESTGDKTFTGGFEYTAKDSSITVDSENHKLSVNYGNGLTLDDTGKLSVNPGTNLSFGPDGKLNSTYSYSLPTASNTVKGGVKVGTGLKIVDELLSLIYTEMTETDADEYFGSGTSSPSVPGNTVRMLDSVPETIDETTPALFVVKNADGTYSHYAVVDEE